ncbi:hypothetical protein Salat_0649400 [Sesamum alatum]|uniref:CCHC-type domain-containing protein n=1 Tax=Sesamum alatum TaxID=300844 RepID=A0AAE1YQP1_9LAMI|nr:hypothetical protein Salat_0649400 [Sesamum alatum]
MMQLRSSSGKNSRSDLPTPDFRTFCFLCGRLGHIARSCDLQYEERFSDPGPHTPYGAWLRQDGRPRQGTTEAGGNPIRYLSPFIGIRCSGGQDHGGTGGCEDLRFLETSKIRTEIWKGR